MLGSKKISNAVSELLKRFESSPTPPDLESFEIPLSQKQELAASSKSDLGRIFYGHDGRTIDKWTQYIEIYERHLAPYRDTKVKILEITSVPTLIEEIQLVG